MNTNSNDSCRYTAFLCGKGTFYISIAVLVLFVINCFIIGLNRHTQNQIVTTQQELAEKSAAIQKNQIFGNIYQSLLQALATAAIVKKDEQIKNLLAQNNIKITPKGAAPAGNAPAIAPAPAAPAAE